MILLLEFSALDVLKWGVEILVFALIGGVVIFAGELACLVGVFVAIPVFYVAWWLFYVEHRDAILAAAAEAGVEATA